MSHSESSARDSQLRYRFKSKNFDFMFQWILGSSSNGGIEPGELMYAASIIRDGDGDDWFTSMCNLAERVIRRGDISLHKKCDISAGESYLRAYIYYRVAPLFIDPKSDKRYYHSYQKARELFSMGIDLIPENIKPFSIPYDGIELSGYIASPDTNKKSGKTLMMLGGGDTFAEDLWFYIGPPAIRRGYELILVDLPGQGDMPWKNSYFSADAEKPIGALMDYFERETHININRLGLYGISAGGYLAPRAASKESRIKAVIACSAQLDFEPVFKQKFARFEKSLLAKYLEWFKPHLYKSIMGLFKTYLWRWGATNVENLIELCIPMKTDPSEIQCPMLNLVGENEYRIYKRSREIHESCMKHIKDYSMVITPANEGADSHGIGTNISLMSQLVFDWLDSKI